MSFISIVILIVAIIVIAVVYRIEERINSQAVEKFVVWLFFSVLFALLPLIFNGGVLLIQGNPIDFSQLLSNGELLIVCAGISASATGHVLISNISRRLARVLATSSCIIILTLSSYCFAFISSSPVTNINTENVAELSITIFCLTMLTSIPVEWMSIQAEVH